MTTDAPEYNDDLSAGRSRELLWMSILQIAIDDAVNGVPAGGNVPKLTRIRITETARNYITTPNQDFNEVCSLAGLDPEAVRDRLTKRIANARTPEELAKPKAPSRKGPPRGKQLTHNGQTLNVTAWAEQLGISSTTIQHRLRKGWPIEYVLAPKHQGHRFAPLSTDRPGVPADFAPFEGTGGGRTLQDCPNITFPEKAPQE